MACLVRASDRFGRQWPAADPEAARVAAIADHAGDDAPALVAGILALDTVFAPALAARPLPRRPSPAPSPACSRPTRSRVQSRTADEARPAHRPLPRQPLAEVADWSAAAGFEALEVACWPRTSGPTRRYAGTSHIDVAALSDAEARETVAALADKGLTISALGYYPNPLHPDPAHREAVTAHLKQVIDAASRMGLGLVNTFCGGDAAKSVDENWQDALTVWPDIVAYARDTGVKLAFENCPMIFSRDEWPGGHNIAYSPRIWRRILEAWGGDVGMNFDPSHLVWQMIDQARFLREFGPTSSTPTPRT